MRVLPRVLAHDALDFGVAKKKASHTELQSVKHGTHTNTPWLENTP